MHKSNVVLAIGVLIALCGVARADCESGNSIQTKNDDGTILTLTDGSTWRVIGGGEVDSQLWMEGEDVLVCDDGTIINKDEENEQVSVELLSR